MRRRSSIKNNARIFPFGFPRHSTFVTSRFRPLALPCPSAWRQPPPAFASLMPSSPSCRRSPSNARRPKSTLCLRWCCRCCDRASVLTLSARTLCTQSPHALCVFYSSCSESRKNNPRRRNTAMVHPNSCDMYVSRIPSAPPVPRRGPAQAPRPHCASNAVRDRARVPRVGGRQPRYGLACGTKLRRPLFVSVCVRSVRVSLVNLGVSNSSPFPLGLFECRHSLACGPRAQFLHKVTPRWPATL